jgi:hypothetical protein
MSATIGIDTFLDSFQNPEKYQFLQHLNTDQIKDRDTHVIIQKSSHPDFHVTYGDAIVYFEESYGFQYGKIDLVSTELQNTIYYIISETEEIQHQPVFEHQVVGKVISSVDTSFWNTLSLDLWMTVITRINPLSYQPK